VLTRRIAGKKRGGRRIGRYALENEKGRVKTRPFFRKDLR